MFVSFLLFVFIVYLFAVVFFFFKQKTAYEMRISDWSSDVCSSDLPGLYALTFVRVVTVDDFGRTVFSEPSHRYLSITLDDAYRIIGKKPTTRILKSSSKVAKVTPNQGHIGHNPRVTIDPSTMTDKAEINGSAKGTHGTQLSTSRGGGVGLVPPAADRPAGA